MHVKLVAVSASFTWKGRPAATGSYDVQVVDLEPGPGQTLDVNQLPSRRRTVGVDLVDDHGNPKMLEDMNVFTPGVEGKRVLNFRVASTPHQATRSDRLARGESPISSAIFSAAGFSQGDWRIRGCSDMVKE